MVAISTTLQRSQYIIIVAGLSLALGIIFNVISFRTNEGFISVEESLISFGVIYTTIVISLNVAIAILTSMVASTLILKFRAVRAFRASGETCVGAGALIAITAGCPVCTVPLLILLGLLGFSTSLVAFPLQGLEFKLISLALITLSLYWISKSSSPA